MMQYEIGDIVKLKKKHPCGSYEWEILRVGADFRLKCAGCGHQIMIARKLVEKNTKGLRKKDEKRVNLYLHSKAVYGRMNPRDILFYPCFPQCWEARDQKEVNSMNKYELALVVNAKIEDEAREAVVEKAKGYITRYNGTVTEVEEWGKKRLCLRNSENA